MVLRFPGICDRRHYHCVRLGEPILHVVHRRPQEPTPAKFGVCRRRVYRIDGWICFAYRPLDSREIRAPLAEMGLGAKSSLDPWHFTPFRRDRRQPCRICSGDHGIPATDRGRYIRRFAVFLADPAVRRHNASVACGIYHERKARNLLHRFRSIAPHAAASNGSSRQPQQPSDQYLSDSYGISIFRKETEMAVHRRTRCHPAACRGHRRNLRHFV